MNVGIAEEPTVEKGFHQLLFEGAIEGPSGLAAVGRLRRQASRSHAPARSLDSATVQLAGDSSAECEQARFLLTCIAEGNTSAFWDLWQRYQKQLFLVCLRLMGGRHADAEDALSRAMLKSLDRLPRHAHGVINPRAWLTRLTYNVCVEMHREQSRRKIDLNSDPESAQSAVVQHVFRPNSICSPDEALLRDEVLAVLRSAVDRLPPRLRDPFVLRFEQEISCRQIAERLMLTTENVRKRIQKARGVLRTQLSLYLSDYRSAPLGSVRVDRFDGPAVPAASKRSPSRQPLSRQAPAFKTADSTRSLKLCSVEVTLPSGERSDFLILLNHQPRRQLAKLKTLSRYLENHPRGWKKRLEMAHLLYTMGRWQEAIDHYRYVLKKQPNLAEVRLAMANLLRMTQREQEAIEAYRSALALITSASVRHRVRGMIELCRGDHDAASKEFERGALAGPHDEAGWRDLGLAYLNAGNFDGAFWAFDQAATSAPAEAVFAACG